MYKSGGKIMNDDDTNNHIVRSRLAIGGLALTPSRPRRREWRPCSAPCNGALRAPLSCPAKAPLSLPLSHCPCPQLAQTKRATPLLPLMLGLPTSICNRACQAAAKRDQFHLCCASLQGQIHRWPSLVAGRSANSYTRFRPSLSANN